MKQPPEFITVLDADFIRRPISSEPLYRISSAIPSSPLSEPVRTFTIFPSTTHWTNPWTTGSDGSSPSSTNLVLASTGTPGPSSGEAS
ncbi:hypothetical protein N7470_007711 [Penicillium chermesinum]|nr:hypothetical protein N7470_007711 [Penicillium chermesinum]